MLGQDFHPHAISARIVVATWWISVVVFSAAYTGDITAYLTIVDFESTVNSLEEITQQTEIMPLIRVGTSQETLLKVSPL